jgi:lysophospholipase L1-like esterase
VLTLTRPRRLLLGLIVLTLTAGGLSSCSSAQAHKSGDYLALGDSVAFGFQPSAITAKARYAHAGNFTGYPELVAKAKGMTLTNAACPGETSTSLITVGVEDNGCSTVAGTGGARKGYRTKAPLHAKYTGSQLAFAVSFLHSHRQTRLVTLDIGVNDLLVCYRVTSTHCTGASATAQLAQTSKNLSTIVTTLRDTAGYRGPIVLLTNYPASYVNTTATAPYQALNSALTTIAAKDGVQVADGYGAFETPSAAFDDDPCQAGLLIALPSTKCDYHPSAQGQALLAKAVERAVTS